MRLESGQATEQMNRCTVSTAMLFSTCLHMLQDHTVIVPTNLRTHGGPHDIHEVHVHVPQGQLEIKWFHTQTGVLPGKRDQSTK